MNKTLICDFRQTSIMALLLVWFICQPRVQANPTGGTVGQGAASFSTSGSQFTVNQTSANAFINWQSFNIGAGETTTFNQPSSSSVTWNQINDSNPSQILGNLNANGYVILQNQNGFYVGGSAVINAHNLVMTTASTPNLNLSSGGPWSFNAPPPTAKIINYGQINITGGGSAFLIASDIENANDGTSAGTISAPGGRIGLYAGQKVLISTSPDGRGLSTRVTLPEGSVDNEGNLIADAGSIAAQAQTVNQGGFIQANSVKNVNGTIELVAGDSVNLGANSIISAQGDNTGASSGGAVTIRAGNTFSDQAGSAINISGGAQGGNGGQVEISASSLGAIQSEINGHAANGFSGASLTLDPLNVTVDSAYASSLDALISGGLSAVNVQADNNITLSTLWNLADQSQAASLTFTAGNKITFNNNSGIAAGNNWSVTMSAGPNHLTSKPASGTDGIYLLGNSFLQTQNGDINLWAANEILVATGASSLVLNNGIRTLNGGNIQVTTQFGNVNTGANPLGYIYSATQPYYSVATDTGLGQVLGGISTAAGGNVTINAGGNVNSYLPTGSAASAAGDAGCGAFGPEPGNVTITAGGSVFGHYVVANGAGTITAGQNIGGSVPSQNVALSLVKGSWQLNAPNGNIYLQEVRNPNGTFNVQGGTSSASYHFFDYAPDASVDLNAGIGVYLTGSSLPRPAGGMPAIYPPSLYITAGSGGVVLQNNVTLFPSPDGNLEITTTGGGSLVTQPNTPGTFPYLLMSDSSRTQYLADGPGSSVVPFGPSDHGATPIELNNPNPVTVNISGDVVNFTLITTKETQIKVDGNMIGSGFSGENLHPGDVTSINVAGQIYNRSSYSFIYGVNIPNLPAADLLPGMANSWDDIFTLALNPASIAALPVPANLLPSQWAAFALQGAGLFQVQLVNGQPVGVNPGFVYNLATGRLGFTGSMSQSLLSSLTQQPTFTVLQLGTDGLPLTFKGNDGNTYFKTTTVSWVDPGTIGNLYLASLGAPSPSSGQLGYRIGGPGQFDINAGSISLGNTYGILSCGAFDAEGGFNRYQDLAPFTPSGATLDVTVAGNLDMFTSTIAALGGGDVNVTSLGGTMDLGSQELFATRRKVGFGVYTTGGGDVNVTALGNINIDGSRIATYNGGTITIESQHGNVNAGTGGTTFTTVQVSYVDPLTGKAGSYTEVVFGSGIVAYTLVDPKAAPGSAVKPGDINVLTPRGDIIASLGGIIQESLNGNVSAGPTIDLTAGTFASGTPGSPDYSAGYGGNIDLGNSGVIGGAVNAIANGNITGLVISRQNSTINAAQNFSGTVLAGGTANLSAGGSVSGVIIGVGGASVSGGSVSADVLGQNVSVNGGASQSTLGSSANATSASQSAANQSDNNAKQQLASDDTESDDEKKKKKAPAVQRMKRVTVILPRAG